MKDNVASDVVVGVVEVVNAAAITVKLTGRLVIPDMDAVMSAVPIVTPVAKPVKIVAVPVLSLTQITCEVMSAIELSE